MDKPEVIAFLEKTGIGADEASSLAQQLKRFNRDGIKVAAQRALVTINFK